MRWFKILMICTMVLLLSFGSVFDLYAQSGRITGRVIDKETGEPLVGVNVLLEGTTRGAATDGEGYYNILNITPGTYNVRASMIGYATQIVEDVRVHVNETVPLDFQMEIEAILGETVVVTAERPTVRLDLSSSRYLLDSQTMQATSVQRFDEVLALFPGISLTAGEAGSGLVIRGGGLDETDIIIDGISTRDRRTQQPNTNVSLTAINEIEILSGGFTAQHGGIRSGLINVVMKEGRMDQYSLAVDVRVSPPQQKHFGPSPYSINGPFWQVYAGPDAFTGVTQEMVDAGKYPFTFVGWNEVARQFLADGDPATDMTPQELLEVWKWQHRPREYANKPDYVFDGTLSGRVPLLPLTFVLSQRYEDLQLVYPFSRNNSIASSTMLKLTSRPIEGVRINFNNALNIDKGVTGGSMYNYSYGMITGTRQGTVFARNTLEKRNLWHQAANNPIERFHYRGGIALNHVLSPKTFYELILEYETYRTDVSPMRLRDTSCVKIIAGKCYDEQPFGYVGSAIGSITEQYDILGEFLMSGGGRGQDHSRYWATGLNFDLVSQLARNYQLQAGFSASFSKHSERREVNHGATTTPYDEAPHLWTYYDATPVQLAGYVQNRFEYRNMIANFGIRFDYLHPRIKPFILDPEFIFDQLPYTTSAFRQNNLSFSHLQTDERAWQLYISPRLGISHPLTENSKIFFNYGHFYQPPVIDRLYEVIPSDRGATIPNVTMKWPKTISYEAGFEVHAGRSILLTFTGYYKDVTNQPGLLNIVSWDRDNDIRTWDNTSYADIRGVELRAQKLYGTWMFGWVAFEYSARSTGYTGLRYIYEDPMLRKMQRNTVAQSRTTPLPSVTANITLQTPEAFGPRAFGINILGGWRLNISQAWSKGGELLLNPDDLFHQHRYARYIDYWNTDILLSKDLFFAHQRIGIYMQVTNLFNYRGIPYPMDWYRYLDSLKFPFYEGDRKGNDKIGDWKADHIQLGWYTWNQWINPRHVSFGIRANF